MASVAIKNLPDELYLQFKSECVMRKQNVTTVSYDIFVAAMAAKLKEYEQETSE
jgi:DNA-dependent RNA polymerase auxiliary subunit epsilon